MYFNPTVAPVSPMPSVPLAVAPVAAIAGKALELSPQQIVRATVEEEGAGRALLDAEGERFWIETDEPLQSGSTLWLQVAEGEGGRLELHRLPPSAGDYLLRQLFLLQQPSGLAGALRLLRERLPAQTAPALQRLAWALEGPDEKALRQFSSDLGLELEAHLAQGEPADPFGSLKGLLLAVLKEAGPALEQAALQVLPHLELWQLAAAAAAERGGYCRPLPLPGGELGAWSGTLNDSDEHLLHLALELPHLGALRLDVLISPDGVSVRGLCASAKAAADLQQAGGELGGRLGGLELQGWRSQQDAGASRALVDQLCPPAENAPHLEVRA